MKDRKCILMEQISKYKWKIIAPKGNILLDEIYLSSVYEAENYIKAYISNHNDWYYEMKILKGV